MRMSHLLTSKQPYWTFGCSQNLESLFSDEINDSEFPTTETHDAWTALKGMVDDSFRFANDVGEEYKGTWKHAERISIMV